MLISEYLFNVFFSVSKGSATGILVPWKNVFLQMGVQKGWARLVSWHNLCPGRWVRWRWGSTLCPGSCSIPSTLHPNAWMLGRDKCFLLNLCSELTGSRGTCMEPCFLPTCVGLLCCLALPPELWFCLSNLCLMNAGCLRSEPSFLQALWIIWGLVTENWLLCCSLVDH